MLSILGVGHSHPQNRITNAFLHELEIADEDWIFPRVGIRERRTALPLEYIRATRNKDPVACLEFTDEASAALTKTAVQLAVSRAGISLSDIGIVIAGSSAPQFSSPAQASRLAAALEIEVPAFDVASACSTFALHVHLAAALDATALPDYALLIQPELLTATVDYRDRNTAVLMGDCVSAAIISNKHHGLLRVERTVFEGTPSQWKKITIRAGSHMQMEGVHVQNYAVRKSHSLFQTIKAASQTPVFVGHQASSSILESICRLSAIPAARHWFNVDRFGNCGAAGAPSVLSEHWSEINTKAEIAMIVVGAGLSAGALWLSGADQAGRVSK